MSGQEDFVLVPREPTAEMIAATLPLAAGASGCSMDDMRLAERALMLLEGAGITNAQHQKGLQAAYDLLRDYRAMLSAAPASPQPQGADGDCMAAQAYQVLGFLDEVIEGRVGKPSSEEMIRALDYFSDAQFNENFLPWPKSTHPQPSGDGLSDETLRGMIKDGYEAEADRIGYDPFIDFARAVEARVRSQPVQQGGGDEPIELAVIGRNREWLLGRLRKIANTGQSIEPDHWKFRCMARETAQDILSRLERPASPTPTDEWRRAVEACARIAEQYMKYSGLMAGPFILKKEIATQIRALSPTKPDDGAPHTKEGE